MKLQSLIGLQGERIAVKTDIVRCSCAIYFAYGVLYAVCKIGTNNARIIVLLKPPIIPRRLRRGNFTAVKKGRKTSVKTSVSRLAKIQNLRFKAL